MHRNLFFVEMPAFAEGQELLIDSIDSKHCKKVLRLRPGTQIEIFNGRSVPAVAEILKMTDSGVQIMVKALKTELEPSTKIIRIVCAWLKGDKNEFIVQKCTELGVSDLIFFKAENSVVIESHSKLDRLRKISIEACKQSGRYILPGISSIDALENFDTSLVKKNNSIYLDERSVAVKSICSCASNLLLADEINIFVGPEGSFSSNEYAFFNQLEVLSVSLGNNILRSETAAIAAASIFCLLE